MAYQGILPEDWVVALLAVPPPDPEGAERAAKKHGKRGEQADQEHWEDVYARDGSVPISDAAAHAAHAHAAETDYGKRVEHAEKPGKGTEQGKPAGEDVEHLRARERGFVEADSVGPYRTRALQPWREPFVPDVDERAFALRVGPFTDPYSIPVTPEEVTQVIRVAYEEGGLTDALFTVKSGMTAEEIEAVGKGDGDLGMGDFGLVFVPKGWSPDSLAAGKADQTKAEKEKAKGGAGGAAQQGSGGDKPSAEKHKSAAEEHDQKEHDRKR